MAFIQRKIILREDQYKERLQRLQKFITPNIDTQHIETESETYKIIKYVDDSKILWKEYIEINEMARDDEKFIFVSLSFNDLDELEYFWKHVLKRNIYEA